MKKLILFSLLMLVNFLSAQNSEIFKEANSAYQNGEYQDAITKYESIISSGEASAELYFNLGNAHYKLNHVAPSIYYFEKALQLDPDDEDILNNIEFARNMAIDDIEEVERAGLAQSFTELVNTFRFSTWAWIAIIFSIAFATLFLLYYFSVRPVAKRIFFGTAIFSLVCCLLSIVFAFQQRSFVEENQYAIVFSEEAEVRDEPNLRGDSSFELHEGTKAKVLENYQEWSRIELANGAQGWMKSADLKQL
ncbi:SH3 domain-containing protein [Christiangramia salexigens]|uniref:Ion channel protein n=1 Tax=Christiangramia salexigens TaxID=1913577 RepID=A0A1L3J6G2_9FLAO|nr:tetratricopeptide repeat protein [Christiangramia salexigens]APG60706.1 ion channel protein [Christiangramia salexigens]